MLGIHSQSLKTEFIKHAQNMAKPNHWQKRKIKTKISSFVKYVFILLVSMINIINSVADPEGVHLNPPLCPPGFKYPMKMK